MSLTTNPAVGPGYDQHLPVTASAAPRAGATAPASFLGAK